MKKVFLYFLAIAFFQHSLAQKTHYATIQPVSTEKEIIIKAANIIPTERQFRWQQLELTAFIHFGMNTFTEREWGDGKEDEKLFNPTQLNAEQWVQTLKDAGFKQVIITAKHHDGFCLWPTKTTEHSVKNSAWKNGKGDVVKEVAEACKKLNVGFGVYLSPWDRNATLYGTEAYNDFFVKQLTELLTAYGKVDEVWFDGANGEGPNGKKQVYDFNRWYTLIRQLQPHAVIAVMGPDVRWVGTESGRGREMEWSVVPANNLEQSAVAADSQKDLVVKPQGDMQGNDLGSREKIKKAGGLVWYPAETDVSIRPGWFYHADQDMKVKSAKQLNDIYFTSVGMNSVLLLNVPPDKRGLINEHDVAALHEWAALRKTIFSNNLLKGALIQCNNAVNLPALNDGKYNTCFTTKDDDTTSSIIMQLKQKSTFNTLLLQEDILAGQRIEKFSAYYNDNHQWIRFAEGSTVGYKRLLRFDTITTQKIKIEIESSRLNPTIAEMGLYYDISAGKK